MDTATPRAPLLGAALLLAAGALQGCAHNPQAQTAGRAAAPLLASAAAEAEGPTPGQLYAWDGAFDISHIEVHVEEQVARFYDGPRQVGWSMVASGVESYPTPTGEFAVTEKIADKRSNIYGRIYDNNGRLINGDARLGRDPVPAGGRFVGAEMPFWMRLTNDGIGLHGGNIPVPGSPASHGCIRLPQAFAPVLFAHVGVGTPVRIVDRSPRPGERTQAGAPG
jgi:hypothetical protein